MSSINRKKGPYKVLCGLCPDHQCKAKLFFPAYDLSIECSGCGQRHAQSALTDIAEVTNPQVALHNLLKNILLGNTTPKKGTDSIKVLGVSNFQCKMLSPLLTLYGMDKQTKRARLLEDMGQGRIFDCGVLGDRVFLIDQEHIEITGYGRDKTGSMNYLRDTLTAIKKFNDDEERLLPIHADGDGHCLVHALSRALIGRELFWHALRENLMQHFQNNIAKYKLQFKEFIGEGEWKDIIAESGPDYTPQGEEAMGLRTIHIFGLANVLKRPIILLDSLSGLQSSGDYTGIFLPGLVDPKACRGKDGSLNKPLCLAWSSSAHNHYIALVPVKGRPLPKLANWMVPKAWGVPNELVSQYINVGPDGTIILGGSKCLQDSYILNLIKAMEEVFMDCNKVSTSLVADVHQYVFKSTGIVGVEPELVIETTQKALQEQRLYCCLTCNSVTEWTILPEMLRPGGSLYNLAISSHGKLSKDKHYSFPMQGLICSYNPKENVLVPEMSRSNMAQCQWCQGNQMRQVHPDGSPRYKNGDKTKNKASNSTCSCGFKHYWEGREYDNLPEILPITLEWNGAVVGEKVTWFQFESDQTLNSNVYEVANRLVQKHFPGEFGSERLAQKVVDTILRQTAIKTQATPTTAAVSDPLSEETVPTKIILTGQQSKSVHKEELCMSETERKVKSSIESKASTQQKRKTDQLAGKQTQSQVHDQVVSKQQKKAAVSPPSNKPSTSESREGPHRQPDQSHGAIPKTTPTQQGKKVRISASDGRQTQWTLTADITFSDLQKRLEEEFSIPPHRQRIRMGFPPTILHTDKQEVDKPLSISHGERITVDFLPDPTQQVVKQPDNPWPVRQEKQTSWSSFDATAREHSAQEMLTGLQNLHESSDSIDMSIATIAMMANMQGKDVWQYVQSMPHLFSVGGLYYQQVKRDLTLTDGKHCTLPSIPGKVFRYSATHDRLELCLEPHGHYAVEPGVEEKVLNDSLINIANRQGALQAKELTTGSSGVVVNPTMKHHQVAFSGQGHSLRSGQDDSMPKELEMGSGQRNRAARFRTLSSGSLDEAIPEEEGNGVNTRELSSQSASDVMSTASKAPNKDFQRVGPGWTVLKENTTSGEPSNNEILRTLAHCIESLVEETEEELLESAKSPQVCSDLEDTVPESTQQLTSEELMDVEFKSPLSDKSAVTADGEINVEERTTDSVVVMDTVTTAISTTEAVTMNTMALPTRQEALASVSVVVGDREEKQTCDKETRFQSESTCVNEMDSST